MGQKVICCSRRSGEVKPVFSPKSSGLATDATGSSVAPSKDPRSAAEYKEKGNQHFKKHEFFSAIEAYSEAIKLDPDVGTYWLNRAIAYRQLNGWEEALSDASRAVELQPESEKAHYTKACALEKLLRVSEAVEACKAGLKRYPENKALTQLQTSLQEKGSVKTQQPRQDDRTASGKKISASVPQPKRNAGKIDYSINYSKWANLEDSDEEVEQKQGHQQIPAPVEEEADEEPETAAHLGKTARANLKAEMMKLAYKMRTDVAGELGLEQRKGSESNKGPVGTITVEELAKYSCSNDRKLTSLYGDIFDVSHHPEEYGSGPKSTHAGKDVTWAVVTEKDVVDNFNRFYDIFKLEHKKLQAALQVICNKLIIYQEKFGQPVGRLDIFERESDLPVPPAGEGPEQCPMM